MKRYRNAVGDSGVVAYDYGTDWIRLQFSRGKPYTYRAAKIGRANLETMKRLADAGDGLTTFINTHPKVRNGYLR
ncbi:hypothetical protein [Opitutus terrae]|uniref:KTSC domain-containing protein n=1 Tax=Opitutus terrae (strain DSM 11246 / JCM 15787 / PB90-1) TaxID=452637 RepID=B1ZZ81_OPITP|nr:hypothetical protein [Opitutus terrae]ACB77153.1 conserved hypothetical protein [Opitutus terrae PB90-1]